MKAKFDREQCTGCGNCLLFCPRNLLKLSGEDVLNQQGTRYVICAEEDKCIGCGQCEQMCTAGAVRAGEAGGQGYFLLDKDKIPPHAGCFLGALAKALADVIAGLGVEKQVVIFKKKTADVNLLVETYDYPDDRFYDDGLAYKKAHPEKLVILICNSSKELSTEKNRERYLALRGERVTLINTLNWFETGTDFQEISKGGCHVLEEAASLGHVSFAARGSTGSPRQMKQLNAYLRKAIENQMEGRAFSIVEIVFPCFYRLAGRPKNWMTYEEIHRINQWFADRVLPDYREGIFKDGGGEG